MGGGCYCIQKYVVENIVTLLYKCTHSTLDRRKKHSVIKTSNFGKVIPSYVRSIPHSI